MNLIALAIKRPTAVAMFTLAVVFTGLAAFNRLPLDLTPDVSFPKLSVVTTWPDTSPETVEAFVTAPIEAAANTVTNVKKVDSISEEGQSTVNIEFSRGTDMDFAALELSEKLSVIRENLPYGVRPPRIQKYVPKEFQTGRFLSYNLTGPYTLQEVRRFALEKLRGPLLAVEGVADVQVYGGTDQELQIELIPARLRALGLSEAQVAAALRDLNLRQAAGRLFRGGQKFDVLLEEPLLRLSEIERAVVSANNGRLVRLGDVAEVSLEYGLPRSYTRINGNPAVVINIEKEVGSNTIRVADRVFARLAELEKHFPPGLRLIKQRDQSERIRTELANLSSRAVFCVAVIFLVLLVALRNFVHPLIILSTIFFSVLLTINLFYFANVGLNLITLAGLALGFGMLVDNSIVVLDNIQRHRERGRHALEAAERGAREMVLPVMAATLTTVAAFLPFLYLTGELRIYYLPFALAVGLSLLSSLVVAFTFTPSLVARVFQVRSAEREVRSAELGVRKSEIGNRKSGRGSRSAGEEDRAFSQDSTFKITPFVRFLAWAVRHKASVLFLTGAVFAGSYYVFDKHVTKGRIWSWGEDTYLVVYINMPTGAELERTDAVARTFESHAVQSPYIDKVVTNVTSENARIHVSFPREVQFTSAPLILKEELTNLAVQVAGPSVGVYGFGPGFYSGGGSAPQFRLEVLGYNYNEVRRIAEAVGRTLARNPRVRDVNTNSGFWGSREDLYETVLRVKRERLHRFQLTAADVLNALQSYLRESLTWQRLKFAGQEIDYRIKMQGHRAFSLEDLRKLLLQTPAGETVRLHEVAEIGERKVLARIVREDQQYQRWISFEYRGPWKFGNRLVDSVVKNARLPHGYTLQRGSFFFLQEEEKRQIYLVIAFALLLVYMVTAGLFESLAQPLIVIVTVPLALIGVFWMFYLTETNFDRSAYIGVVLLAGIVVNNAIILVHHINDLRRRGFALLDAVLQGTADRLRPILMTSATTVLGLLPLVLFTKAEESIWYALSLATIGGLLSSTLLVLVVIPVGYVVLARRTRKADRR